MTTPAKKPAAPRAAAAKTTTRTAAAKPAARVAAKPAAKATPAVAAKPAPVAAPVYEFTKPYKFLTGFDDSEFCAKVSAHLNAGYKLAGSATMTTVGGKVYVGQPVYKHSNVAKPKPKGKAKGKKK
jgi:hypothetical protein